MTAISSAPKTPYLFISTPTNDKRVSTGYLLSLLQTLQILEREGVRVMVEFQTGSGIIMARNAALSNFLSDADATHFLFIDDDMTWEPGAVKALIDSNLDFVSGVYAARATDWSMLARRITKGDIASVEDLFRLSSPLLVKFEDWKAGAPIDVKDNRFIEASGVGSGFMLLTRSAVQKLADVSRRYQRHNVMTNRDDVAYYIVENEFTPNAQPALPGTLLGEDYSLCAKWRKLGEKVWVDIQSQFEHQGPATFTAMPLGEQFAKGKV